MIRKVEWVDCDDEYIMRGGEKWIHPDGTEGHLSLEGRWVGKAVYRLKNEYMGYRIQKQKIFEYANEEAVC
jgi:hypothetical protein